MKNLKVRGLIKKKNVQKAAASGVGTSSPSTNDNQAIVVGNEDAIPPITEGVEETVDLSDEEEMDGIGEKKLSWVWDHFEIYWVTKKENVDGQIVPVKKRRAKCKYCPKKSKVGDYAADSHKNGTTSLGDHLKFRCKYFKKRTADQAAITGDGTEVNNMTISAFDQDIVEDACIKMVVIDEMPFATVEKTGFKMFCRVACPLFKVPSRRLFAKNFFKMYEFQKTDLRKELSRHRISLTTDTWTSVQNMNYMVLTAHFIDSEWTMHKRIINFCQIGNHQGATIGRLIESCLLEWKIDKVLSITMDNASANKTAIEWLRVKMNRWNNSKAILGGKLLHVRCTAHIVNLIVRDGLNKMNKSILAIRNAVAYVRSSPQRLTTFKSAVALEKLACKGLVVLDVPTRWNSTYQMLKSALKFRKAFERLREDDNTFVDYFKEPEADDEGSDVGVLEDDCIIAPRRRRGRVGPPEDDDWEKCRVFVDFLEVFYEVTLRVSSSTVPNVHTTFHDVLSIERKLNSLYVPQEMQNNKEMEQVLKDMSVRMNKKYDKYFGSYKDINPLIMIGLILDPRFKLKNIEHVLRVEGFGENEVQQKSNEFKDLLMELYDVYNPQPKENCNDGGTYTYTQSSMIMSKGASSSSSCGWSRLTEGSSRSVIVDEWEKYVSQTEGELEKHEVDTYLTDKLWPTKNKFSILSWWKVHGAKYPVLANIAKDVLATQVSTVASESSFSTGGRVIDCSRSSMTPRTVEALICLQNWLKSDVIVCSPPDQPSIENYEWWEECESEVDNEASSSPLTEPAAKRAKGINING